MVRARISPTIVNVDLAQINAQGPFPIVDLPENEKADGDGRGDVALEEVFGVWGAAVWCLEIWF